MTLEQPGFGSDPSNGSGRERSATKGDYIKGNRTKHISPKFFYTHELQKSGEINVQQICLSDNLADLFIKSLSTSAFKKLIYKIGMCQLKDIDIRGNMLMT